MEITDQERERLREVDFTRENVLHWQITQLGPTEGFRIVNCAVCGAAGKHLFQERLADIVGNHLQRNGTYAIVADETEGVIEVYRRR